MSANIKRVVITGHSLGATVGAHIVLLNLVFQNSSMDSSMSKVPFVGVLFGQPKGIRGQQPDTVKNIKHACGDSNVVSFNNARDCVINSFDNMYLARIGYERYKGVDLEFDRLECGQSLSHNLLVHQPELYK